MKCIGTKNHPITSYGVILYTESDDVKFLVTQRRDTIPYIDYLRGCLDSHYERYFSLMSNEERSRLVDYSFEELWDDLWTNKESRMYREIDRARNNFRNNYSNMIQWIKNTTSAVEEPPWGFPKGKKKPSEMPRDAAMREFQEETNFDISAIKMKKCRPLVEVFEGSNGKCYKTVYYIAECASEIPVKYIDVDGIRKKSVSGEMADAQWLTLKDAKLKLNPRRQNILNELWLKIYHKELMQ